MLIEKNKISTKCKTRTVTVEVIIWDDFKIVENFNKLFVNIVPNLKIFPPKKPLKLM